MDAPKSPPLYVLLTGMIAIERNPDGTGPSLHNVRKIFEAATGGKMAIAITNAINASNYDQRVSLLSEIEEDFHRAIRDEGLPVKAMPAPEGGWDVYGETVAAGFGEAADVPAVAPIPPSAPAPVAAPVGVVTAAPAASVSQPAPDAAAAAPAADATTTPPVELPPVSTEPLPAELPPVTAPEAVTLPADTEAAPTTEVAPQ